MSLIWAYTLLIDKSEVSSRKMALFAWIILVVIVGRLSYFLVILNGEAEEIVCQTIDLSTINANPKVALEQC